jgi:LPXTG-motif cell wall-anchored protein
VTQPKTYTVVWKDGDGNILKTETVEEGASATPPEGTPTKTPTKDYTYTFEGWDQDYTNVTKDMVILAWFYSTKRDDTTEDPGTTENPGTTEQPGTTEGPKAPNANVTPGGNGANGGQNTSKNPVKYTYMGATGSPQTGDATPIVLLVCAIVFAGAGIVVTIKKRKSF